MTIKEIAKLAGVSVSTVSKVMNGKDQTINQETRARILQIAKDYNYVPYASIRSATSAKTFLLGILVQNLAAAQSFLQGVLQAAAASKYSLLVYESGGSPEEELKHITALCKNRVDCVIWEPVGPDSLSHKYLLEEADVSVCLLNAPFAPDSVAFPFSAMSYLCTEKLIGYRHSRICCLIKDNSLRGEQVLDGFKRCLYDNQIAYSDAMAVRYRPGMDLGKLSVMRFTAFVCSHFAIALQVFQYHQKLRYHIPSDFSLISLCSDNRELSEYPPISNYVIPYQTYGFQTAESLLDRLEHPEGTPPEQKTQRDAASPLLPPPGQDTFTEGETIGSSPDFRKKKILIVGSLHMDYNFTVPHVPREGKAAQISHTLETPGGKATNQAIGVARLGQESILIGKVGNDANANVILEELEQEHVTIDNISRERSADTGKAYVFIPENGEGTMAVQQGANRLFQPDDIFAKSSLFHHAGYCLVSFGIASETVLAALKTARKYGVKTVLKPVSGMSIGEGFLELTDIFVPNLEEARQLCPQYSTVEEEAEYFFQCGGPTVIITLGSRGCYLRTADVSRYYPASAFTVIDTTGGSDAFIAALTSFLNDGYTLDLAIRTAQHAAGFCVSRQGVINALADRNALNAFISVHEPELLEMR